MKNIAAAFLVIVFAGCSSTGIVPMDGDTYLTVKKSPQVGYGPAVGVKADVYAEANDFCAKQKKSVQTVKLDLTDAGSFQSAVASLQFRCVSN